jgi:hypothetical protein
MGGSTAVGVFGTYGPLGVASSSYIPGSRGSGYIAYDSTFQEVWYFGGDGYSQSPNPAGTFQLSFDLQLSFQPFPRTEDSF